MRAMTAYIARPGVATTLASLMADEIKDNAENVVNYTENWTPEDIGKVQPLLAQERNVVSMTDSLSAQVDSAKGESAMVAAYAANGQKKATDIVTQKGCGELALTELKYLVKFASKGPFGGRGSFRERISDKFYEMSRLMESDGESVDPLRIIVVTEEQFPYSVNHVRALVDGGYASGSFSCDGRKHPYVLCTSSSVREMIDKPPVETRDIGKYLFFEI